MAKGKKKQRQRKCEHSHEGVTLDEQSNVEASSSSAAQTKSEQFDKVAPPGHIKVLTTDGDIIIIGPRIIEQSETLTNFIKDNANLSEPYVCEKISTATMKKVLVWCERHKKPEEVANPWLTQPPAEVSNKFKKQYFKNHEYAHIYPVIMAAHSLKIDTLVEAAAKQIAVFLTKNKFSAEEMRAIFQVDDEGSDEESRPVDLNAEMAYIDSFQVRPRTRRERLELAQLYAAAFPTSSRGFEGQFDF